MIERLNLGFVAGLFAVTGTLCLVRASSQKNNDHNRVPAGEIVAHNRTRRSVSMSRKLLRSGHWQLLPVYWLLRLSFLGREGITNSGSYRFADHIYRNQPRGTGWLGRWFDKKLLNMPAARAFRERYLRAKLEMSRLKGRNGKILAIPCGIPRDFSEMATRQPEQAWLPTYYGMDIDPKVISEAKQHLQENQLSGKFFQGNALNLEDYPDEQFDLIISTGLGEFLTDEQLIQLYHNVHCKLAPGGVFFTSATDEERLSEKLMRPFELETNYRNAEQIDAILQNQAWSHVEMEVDPSGLQTFVVARK